MLPTAKQSMIHGCYTNLCIWPLQLSHDCSSCNMQPTTESVAWPNESAKDLQFADHYLQGTWSPG